MNLFSPLIAKILAGVSAVLLLAVVVQTVRVKHYRAKAAELAVQIDKIKAAQEAAKQDQIAVNREPARKSEEIARKSDVEAQTYYEQGRRAGAAYAAANRVRNSCAPSASRVPGTDRPAPVDDGPGDTADMVALSRTDFDTLTGNSVRLAKVQQDTQALIDSGVAIALPDVALSLKHDEP